MFSHHRSPCRISAEMRTDARGCSFVSVWSNVAAARRHVQGECTLPCGEACRARS